MHPPTYGTLPSTRGSSPDRSVACSPTTTPGATVATTMAEPVGSNGRQPAAVLGGSKVAAPSGTVVPIVMLRPGSPERRSQASPTRVRVLQSPHTPTQSLHFAQLVPPGMQASAVGVPLLSGPLTPRQQHRNVADSKMSTSEFSGGLPTPQPEGVVPAADGQRKEEPKVVDSGPITANKASNFEKFEENVGKWPRMTFMPGADAVTKLSQRVQELEKQLTSQRSSSDVQSQELADKILDKVKDTALEALSNSFSQQAAQLQVHMNGIQDSLLSRVDQAMQETEQRLKSQLVSDGSGFAGADNPDATARERVDAEGLSKEMLYLRAELKDMADRQAAAEALLHNLGQDLTAQFEEICANSSTETTRAAAEAAANSSLGSEVAQLRVELESRTGSLQQSVRMEVGEALTQAQEQSARSLAALKEEVASLGPPAPDVDQSLRDEVAALTIQVRALQQTDGPQEEARQELTVLKATVDVLRQQHEAAAGREEVAALRAAVDALKQKDSSHSELQALQELAALSGVVDDLRRQQEAAGAELIASKGEVSALGAALGQAKGELLAAPTQEQVAAIQQELAALGSAVQTLGGASQERPEAAALSELSAALDALRQGQAAASAEAKQELASVRELVRSSASAAPAPAIGEGGTGEGTTPKNSTEEDSSLASAVADVQKEVAALQQGLQAMGGAQELSDAVRHAAEEASERMEARASDITAALDVNAEGQCKKLAEVIEDLLGSATKQLQEKLPKEAPESAGEGGSCPQLDELAQKVSALEKEQASGLQELGELFLGELTGIRASTDEQCRLLLGEIQGERDARSKDMDELKEVLFSLSAADSALQEVPA